MDAVCQNSTVYPDMLAEPTILLHDDCSHYVLERFVQIC